MTILLRVLSLCEPTSAIRCLNESSDWRNEVNSPVVVVVVVVVKGEHRVNVGNVCHRKFSSMRFQPSLV